MNISLLTTTTVTIPTVGAIAALVVLICLIVGLGIYYHKTKPSDYQKSKAYDFLNSLKEELEDTVSEVIGATPTIDFDDFTEYQAIIFDKIYNKAWKLVTDNVYEIIEDPILRKALVKILNKDTIKDFVDDIVAEQNLMISLENIFDGSIKDIEIESQKDEEEAAEIAKAYEEGTVQVEVPEGVDLDKTEFDKGREEYPEKDLPDEETPYSEEDPTMEVIK